MKIVINRCYGGFGLSEQAIDKIYARKRIAFEKKDDQGFVHYFKAGHLGDNVNFTSTKTGQNVTGMVTKIAIKYVTVRTVNGLWRVPANMLTRIEDSEFA